MKRLSFLCVLMSLLLAACAGPPSEPAPPAETPVTPAPWEARDTPAVFAERGVYQPQVVAAEDGTFLFVWREKGSEPRSGSNLYLSRREADGSFSEPARINDTPDSTVGWDHDENRAAVAVDAAGRVAVAFTSRAGGIRAAFSDDGGRSFAPSIRLHQDESRVYRGFVTAAFDGEGVLHAAWIDARHAEEAGAEEPADLFYTRVADGAAAPERSVTDAEGDGSVCGCCQPFMAVDGETLSIVFRNAPPDGYRDIFRVTGTTAGDFSAPERFGPPMWELQGCPSAGPVIAGGSTLWFEASGPARILAADDTGDAFDVVLENEDAWAIRYPARRVAAGAGLLLVPGDPAGRLIRRVDGAWTSVDGALPMWATAAAVVDGEIVAVGSEDGVLRFSARPL